MEAPFEIQPVTGMVLGVHDAEGDVGVFGLGTLLTGQVGGKLGDGSVNTCTSDK